MTELDLESQIKRLQLNHKLAQLKARESELELKGYELQLNIQRVAKEQESVKAHIDTIELQILESK
jgi:hypothetical protein